MTAAWRCAQARKLPAVASFADCAFGAEARRAECDAGAALLPCFCQIIVTAWMTVRRTWGALLCSGSPPTGVKSCAFWGFFLLTSVFPTQRPLDRATPPDASGVLDWEAAVRRVNGGLDDFGPEDEAFYIDLLLDYYLSAKEKVVSIFKAGNSFRAGVDSYEHTDDKFKEVKYVEEVRQRCQKPICAVSGGDGGCSVTERGWSAAALSPVPPAGFLLFSTCRSSRSPLTP